MEFKTLIKKLNNNLTDSEHIEFEKWYNESEQHRIFFENVKRNKEEEKIVDDIEKSWKRLAEKTIHVTTPKKNVFWKYAAAASIIFILGLTFIYKDTFITNTDAIIVESTPEMNTAKVTLTLEDGTTVILEEEDKQLFANVKNIGKKLLYETGEVSDKTTYNYLTIPRGKDFFVQLADGSKVWLNSDSKLKYPVSFTPGETRIVELIYGEAYFDISPSTKHKGASFKVINNAQEVEVLGTEFNIKAYEGEDEIATTLIEGKVAIDNGKQKNILKPNEQSKINIHTKALAITEVDVYNEISWRKGIFSFKNMPLKNIMTVLSRWYDINVIFENKEVENEQFNGALNKKQTIEDILNALKSTNTINYEINGKNITIK